MARHFPRMRGNFLGVAAGIAGLCLVAPFSVLAAPASESLGPQIETAFLPLSFPEAKPSPQTALPRVLSDADAQHYRRIFAAQEEASWADADHEIHGLKDRGLLGVVFAQRYLHPKYRTRPDEFAAGLKLYGDLPEGTRSY